MDILFLGTGVAFFLATILVVERAFARVKA
jgi:hypothetical protein